MFFLVSKIAWIVLRPLNFFVLLTIAAFILRWRGYRRIAATASGVLALSFVAIGFTQLPDLLVHRLEMRVPANEPAGTVYGIIVLGGALEANGATANPPAWKGFRLGESADRLVLALELRRRFPQARFIYSGGLSNLAQTGQPETEGARRVIEALTGASAGMEFEDKSRNTAENAAFVAEMVGEARKENWLLVTSAFHMARAIACFRKAGFNIAAAPTDYRAQALKPPYLSADAAGQFQKAALWLKEQVGLCAYYLSGKIEKPY